MESLERSLLRVQQLVRQCTRTTHDGRPFVLRFSVAKLLQESTILAGRSDLESFWIQLLPNIQVNPSTRSDLTWVLCILIQLNIYTCIQNFVSGGISDRDLPVTRDQLENLLTTLPPKVWEEYSSEQARWFPIQIDNRMAKSLSHDEIFPAVSMRPIKGHSETPCHSDESKPTVWRAEIPVQLVSRDLFDHTTRRYALTPAWLLGTINPTSKNSNDQIFECAIKTFPWDLESDFRAELRNLQLLDNPLGFVQCFGWYETCGTPQSKTFNILFELGSINLSKLLQHDIHLTSSAGVKSFWESFASLPGALSRMHHIVREKISYQGWHGDLKPQNIILVGRQFQITDVGESVVLPLPDPRTCNKNIAFSATVTYAAPESNNLIGPSKPTCQKADIWSLGSIFSLVASFIIFGHQGVNDFTQKRAEGVKKRLGFAADIFYNELEPSPEVTEWHERLRQNILPGDAWTGPMLDLVDNHMLVAVKHRFSAAEVDGQMREILFTSRTNSKE